MRENRQVRQPRHSQKPFDNIRYCNWRALTQKWLLSHQVKNRLQDLDQAVSRHDRTQSANEQLKKEITERMQMETALRFPKSGFPRPSKPALFLWRSSRSRRKNFGRQPGLPEVDRFRSRRTDRAHRSRVEPLDRSLGKRRHHREPSQANVRPQFPPATPDEASQQREILISVELFELNGEPLLLTMAQDRTEQIALETSSARPRKWKRWANWRPGGA